MTKTMNGGVTKLLPCPFCGGGTYTYTATYVENGLKRKSWLVHCKKCALNYPTSKNKCFTEAEAIKKWNTRKPMQEIVERLEDSAKRCHYSEEEFKDSVVKVPLSEKWFSKACSYEYAIEVVKEVGGMND